MPVISVCGEDIFYKLKRSKRAKHLRMEYGLAGAKLIAPYSVSNQIIIQFIFEQKKWLAKRSQAISKTQNLTQCLWPQQYLTGEKLPFLGESLIIDVQFSEDLVSPIILKNSLCVTLPLSQQFSAIQHLVKEQVLDWLKRQARNHVQRFVGEHSHKLGRKPTGVTLKLQRRRWGSCGIHDHIYINWLLILAPLPVLSYVVLHECCHLFYRNHGTKFWKLVEKHMPDYKTQEDWLRKHSNMIQPP